MNREPLVLGKVLLEFLTQMQDNPYCAILMSLQNEVIENIDYNYLELDYISGKTSYLLYKNDIKHFTFVDGDGGFLSRKYVDVYNKHKVSIPESLSVQVGNVGLFIDSFTTESKNIKVKKTWYIIEFNKIRYIMSPNRLKAIEVSPFNNNRRTECKFGKVIKKLVGDRLNNLSETEKSVLLENVVTSMVAFSKSKISDGFRIVKGKEIVQYYNTKNYSSINGTLGRSCMNNNKDRVTFYDGDEVSLLIYVNPVDNKIMGRALLWNYAPNQYYLDRVYTCAEFVDVLYTNYSKSNNFLKYGTRIENKIEFNYNPKSKFRMTPYLDSFNYNDGKLILRG